MGIDVTATEIVQRPRGELAAFLADPANDPKWIRALTRVEAVETGAIGVGSRVRREAKMLGRTIRWTTEITELDAGRRVAMRTVEGPFPMAITYELEDAEGGGTLIHVHNRGGGGFVYGLLGPLMGRMVRSRVQGDLRALKAELERR